jgi:spermidine synthase
MTSRLRITVFILFFASGATGLVYEVVWVRLLSQTFGNTVFAVSTVLAVFMAGLGAGGYLVGKWIDRRGNFLTVYGYLEIGVGVAALAVLILLRIFDPVITRLASLMGATFFGQSLLRLTAAFLLLFPPTFLMGGTLPVLSKYILRHRQSLGWDIGALYGVNTLGAMTGTFLAGFVLIDLLGLRSTEISAVAANLLIGATALLVSRRQTGGTLKETRKRNVKPEATAPVYGRRVIIAALVAYGLSGFAALAGEVVWSRVLIFFLGNSTYAFSTLLTTFLGALALGSLAGSKIADRTRDPIRMLAAVEGTLAVLILATIPVLWQGLYTSTFRQLLTDPSLPWITYLGIKFLTTAVVLFPPAFLFGMAFPLVCKIALGRLETVGRGVGLIYALNTAGAILGSLLTGFVFVPAFGLQLSLAGAAWVTAGAAVTLVAVHPSAAPRLRNSAAFAAAALIVLSLLLFPLQRTLRSFTQSAGDTVLFYSEDHTATVLVYQKPSGDKFVSVDGHFIGATEHESDKKQRLLGYLPVLLTSDPESALTIGLGSGITLGALAQFPELRSIEAVEIVPSMVTAARFFDQDHGSVLSDPRVEIIVGDGINFVKTTRRRFDVISSDAKLNPEYVGNALVYTKEYYQWSRARLTPGGVFIQWVPLYLPDAIFRTVVRTFTQVFPAVDLWFFPTQHTMLVGRNSEQLFDFAALSRRLAASGVSQNLGRFGLSNPYVLASSHIADRDQLIRYAGEGPINTWDRPVIEFRSIQEFRRSSRGVVEEENLRQLLGMLNEGKHPFSNCDADSLTAYVESFRLVLRGLIKSKRTDLLTYGRGDFESALARNPNDGRAKDLIAQAAAESRLAETATSAGKGPSPLRLANLLYAEGKYTEAEKAVRTAISANPNQAEAYNTLGLILRRQGKGNAALTAFQKAHNLAPNEVQITLNLATAYESQGRLEEALGMFQKVLQASPENPELHNNAGIVFAKMGRHEEAITEYRRAIQLDPGYADAFNNLGIALGVTGRTDEAIRAFQKALRINPRHVGALKNLGNTYLQTQRFSDAAKALQTVIELDATDVDALTNLGLAYAQTGRLALARECWQKALSLDPSLKEARQNLEILKKMGY